jgi:glucose 1-dehydrogenase
VEAIAVTPQNRKVEVINQAEPKILTPTDVKLRMLEAGLCGTDKEICAFEYGTPPSGSEQLVIGHESLGEVVEVGPNVTRVKVGDLVVPMVRRPCPHDYCVACRADRQDFCFTGDFQERGIKERHGFMAQFVLDHEKYMNLVPREMRDVAVLVEPLTIAEKGLTQVWQVQQRLPWSCPVTPGKAAAYRHRAVVLGAGPVGLLGAMALVNNDFDTYVYSREPYLRSRGTESITCAKLHHDNDKRCIFCSKPAGRSEGILTIPSQVSEVFCAPLNKRSWKRKAHRAIPCVS